MEKIRRYTPARGAKVETRADGNKVICGYAAVFYNSADPGTQYELWPGNVERIMPTAFDRAIREKDDCRALVNHNPDLLLGRTSAGTLKLFADTVGLGYEIIPPNTQAAKDCIASIERGDMTGSSFGFSIRSRTIREEGDITVREINDAELFDVSPVTYPAYESATTGTRADGNVSEARTDIESFKAQKRDEGHQIALRMALKKKLLELRERE